MNRQALMQNDETAILALRAPDFHVVTPDRVTHDAGEMRDFAHNLVVNVQKWEDLSFAVGDISQNGDEISADVQQHSISLQRRNDGNIHRIENWVTQRETWVETPQGLRMRRVENIRDQRVLIDGKPR
jgi:hypothetical protein